MSIAMNLCLYLQLQLHVNLCICLEYARSLNLVVTLPAGMPVGRLLLEMCSRNQFQINLSNILKEYWSVYYQPGFFSFTNDEFEVSSGRQMMCAQEHNLLELVCEEMGASTLSCYVKASLTTKHLPYCRHFVFLLLLSHFSHVRLCATPQTAAHQASPFLGFSRQEHWSGLPFPSPENAAAAAAAKSLQLCSTLCDPRDGSPPGSPVPGILQARTQEWVAISFSST